MADAPEDDVLSGFSRAQGVLSEMESMVERMLDVSSSTLEQIAWFDLLQKGAEMVSDSADNPQDCAQACVELAGLIFHGPYESLVDKDESDSALLRRRMPGALVIEAALWECSRGKVCAKEVRQVLQNWLALGSGRLTKSPLTQIAQMIEQTSESPVEAVATRLGLLVPFWSSIALWGALSQRRVHADALVSRASQGSEPAMKMH